MPIKKLDHKRNQVVVILLTNRQDLPFWMTRDPDAESIMANFDKINGGRWEPGIGAAHQLAQHNNCFIGRFGETGVLPIGVPLGGIGVWR